MYREDIRFLLVTIIPSIIVLFFLGVTVYVLIKESIDIFSYEGLFFILGSKWSAMENTIGVYSIFPQLLGSFISSIIAIIIALPMSIGTVVFINEYAPRRISNLVSSILLIASGFPTVIYGLWGMRFLTDLVKNYLAPFLYNHFRFIVIFSCTPNPGGYSILTAGILLSIMAVPYITTVINEAYKSIPHKYREGIYSLGALRYQAVLTLLGIIRPAIMGAILLGLGRAFSETVAVTMVIGNVPNKSLCILESGQTITSLIATQFGNSGLFPLMSNALYGAGLLLLIIGITLSLVGIYLITRWRMML